MAGNGATAQQVVRPFWDVERVIGKVRKNDRGEVIQIRHTEKDSRTYVDVRVFYPGGDDGLRPGKGIALPSDLADEVAGYILQAGEAIRS